jgi:hypothetical protein
VTLEHRIDALRRAGAGTITIGADGSVTGGFVNPGWSIGTSLHTYGCNCATCVSSAYRSGETARPMPGSVVT